MIIERFDVDIVGERDKVLPGVGSDIRGLDGASVEEAVLVSYRETVVGDVETLLDEGLTLGFPMVGNGQGHLPGFRDVISTLFSTCNAAGFRITKLCNCPTFTSEMNNKEAKWGENLAEQDNAQLGGNCGPNVLQWVILHATDPDDNSRIE